MSLPSLRTMPTLTATYYDIRRAWVIVLPGGVALEAGSVEAIQTLRDKHAPGSAIRWCRELASESEAEFRAAYGDR